MFSDYTVDLIEEDVFPLFYNDNHNHDSRYKVFC